MKKGEKIYNDGISAELRYYRRHKEKIALRRAEYIAKNPEHVAAVRAAYKERRKENVAAQKRIYRQKKKEKIAAYFAEHKERFSANRKAKYAANKEKISEARRKRYAENKKFSDAIKERSRARYAKDPEKMRARSIAWAAAHPEIVRLIGSTKRARKRNAKGSVSKDIAERLMRLQRGKCPVCRCDLQKANSHLDHIEPISRGGAHDDANMQLLCKACNMSKHAKPPIEFMQSRGFLL